MIEIYANMTWRLAEVKETLFSFINQRRLRRKTSLEKNSSTFFTVSADGQIDRYKLPEMPTFDIAHQPTAILDVPSLRRSIEEMALAGANNKRS